MNHIIQQKNKQLEKLYLTLIKELKEKKKLTKRTFSKPLLLKLTENYITTSNNVKIMIIGKQTNTWVNDICIWDKSPKEAVRILMKEYEVFLNDGGDWRSKFWGLSNYIKMKTNAGLIWSNVIRLDYKGSQPSTKDAVKITALFRKYISQELKILKPDIILLFAPPSYDKYIETAFGKIKFVDLKGFGHYLQKAKWLKLDIPIYRTYHPDYLGTYMKEKQKKIVPKIEKRIIKDIKALQKAG